MIFQYYTLYKGLNIKMLCPKLYRSRIDLLKGLFGLKRAGDLNRGMANVDLSF